MIPSKEDILSRQVDYIEYPHYAMNDFQQRTCYDAMDEHAKNIAIGFANFVGNRPLPEYSQSTNQWRWWDNGSREYQYATTEELFNQYLNQLEK